MAPSHMTKYFPPLNHFEIYMTSAKLKHWGVGVSFSAQDTLAFNREVPDRLAPGVACDTESEKTKAWIMPINQPYSGGSRKKMSQVANTHQLMCCCGETPRQTVHWCQMSSIFPGREAQTKTWPQPHWQGRRRATALQVPICTWTQGNLPIYSVSKHLHPVLVSHLTHRNLLILQNITFWGTGVLICCMWQGLKILIVGCYLLYACLGLF